MCGESRMHGADRGKTRKPRKGVKALPIGIVYGIAITAMSFFTDPTISTLTSGTPSQNVDLGGLSFPRRMGVRFSPDFVKKNHFMGLQCKWDSFEDPAFTKNLGKDFEHEDIVDRNGWAMYYFKGKYAKDVAYPRLRIVNPQTGMLVRTFYFEFRKSYQMSLDSRYYVKDPVLGEKIVKNGLLFEMKPVKVKSKDGSADRIVYKRAKTTFVQEKIKDVLHGGKKEKINALAITQNMVRYSDKPKMVFLVEFMNMYSMRNIHVCRIQRICRVGCIV